MTKVPRPLDAEDIAADAVAVRWISCPREDLSQMNSGSHQASIIDSKPPVFCKQCRLSVWQGLLMQNVRIDSPGNFGPSRSRAISDSLLPLAAQPALQFEPCKSDLPSSHLPAHRLCPSKTQICPEAEQDVEFEFLKLLPHCYKAVGHCLHAFFWCASRAEVLRPSHLPGSRVRATFAQTCFARRGGHQALVGRYTQTFSTFAPRSGVSCGAHLLARPTALWATRARGAPSKPTSTI